MRQLGWMNDAIRVTPVVLGPWRNKDPCYDRFGKAQVMPRCLAFSELHKETGRIRWKVKMKMRMRIYNDVKSALGLQLNWRFVMSRIAVKLMWKTKQGQSQTPSGFRRQTVGKPGDFGYLPRALILFLLLVLRFGALDASLCLLCLQLISLTLQDLGGGGGLLTSPLPLFISRQSSGRCSLGE